MTAGTSPRTTISWFKLALRGRVVAVALAQLHLQGLPRGCVRDLLHELDRVGQRPLGVVGRQVGEKILLRSLRAFLEDHDPERTFLPPLVRYGDHGGLGYGVVGHQGVLEGDGGDPLPRTLYEVLGSVLYLHVPVFVDGDYVAGLEPAVIRELLAVFLCVEVRSRDPRAPDLQLAHRLPVPWDELLLVAPRPELDKRPGQALLGPDAVALVLRGFVEEGTEVADGAKGGRLGHPPGVEDAQPVALLKGPDHPLRRSRTPDDHGPQGGEVVSLRVLVELAQDTEEDGGHPRRDGDPLLREVLEQALGVEVGPWHDLLSPYEGRGEGQPPGVDVEHGNHRHDRVALADPQHIGRGGGHRVQADGPGRVERP